MLKSMLLAAALLAGGLLNAQINVKNNDKIAFLGDSITAMGNWQDGYLNIVVDTLKANGVTVEKIGAGISGHKSDQMLNRLQKDVIAREPAVMTLSCGVNDVWHGKRGIPLDAYKKNITTLVDRAAKAGIRVYILTATMIGEDAGNPNNVKLAAYNDFLRQLAKDKGCVLVDLNADMQNELAALRKQNPGIKGNLITRDGVHMLPRGNRMMARGILRAFGLTDAEIAKGEAAYAKKWCDVRYGGMSIADYDLLEKNAFAAKLSVGEYIKSLIRRDVKK